MSELMEVIWLWLRLQWKRLYFRHNDMFSDTHMCSFKQGDVIRSCTEPNFIPKCTRCEKPLPPMEAK